MLQGEQEAEKMIVEAYAALLLAFLSTERLGFLSSVPFFPSLSVDTCLLTIFFFFFADSSKGKGVRDAIAECLPDRNLAILVPPVLDRFVVCI